jgi:hypothetical protein
MRRGLLIGLGILMMSGTLASAYAGDAVLWRSPGEDCWIVENAFETLSACREKMISAIRSRWKHEGTAEYKAQPDGGLSRDATIFFLHLKNEAERELIFAWDVNEAFWYRMYKGTMGVGDSYKCLPATMQLTQCK